MKYCFAFSHLQHKNHSSLWVVQKQVADQICQPRGYIFLKVPSITLLKNNQKKNVHLKILLFLPTIQNNFTK